jgi:hypothetical protein
MTDFENEIGRKRNMTCEKFDEIREQFYGDGKNIFKYKYGEVSSWLTWNRNENNQIAKVEPPTPEYTKGKQLYDGPIDKWDDKYASRITTDIIFLGLNMSGDGTPFIDSKGNKWPSFQNARGNESIIHTFFNTSAEGAYFTDIIKPDSRLLNNIGKPADSKEVRKIIETRRDILNDHVRLFEKELKFIGANKPLLIVFGNDANWALRNGLDDNFLKERFYEIIKILHYTYPRRSGMSNEEYKNDTRKKLAQFITIP